MAAVGAFFPAFDSGLLAIDANSEVGTLFWGSLGSRYFAPIQGPTTKVLKFVAEHGCMPWLGSNPPKGLEFGVVGDRTAVLRPSVKAPSFLDIKASGGASNDDNEASGYTPSWVESRANARSRAAALRPHLPELPRSHKLQTEAAKVRNIAASKVEDKSVSPSSTNQAIIPTRRMPARASASFPRRAPASRPMSPSDSQAGASSDARADTSKHAEYKNDENGESDTNSNEEIRNSATSVSAASAIGPPRPRSPSRSRLHSKAALRGDEGRDETGSNYLQGAPQS